MNGVIDPISLRSIAISRPLLSSWSSGPSPPRLPKEEQEIFDKLQAQSTGTFSTPAKPSRDITDTGSQTSDLRSRINQSPDSQGDQPLDTRVSATGERDELHPDIRRGAKPEFEGNRNPKTGEVGGPKNEPLRWGASGDYSFNGRVTDF
ncbi:hypothetical protein M501DRAFT_1010764 [Patellaria atrata CBS 101060]|uniref:Succinate dehydrogenase assembly factor 4, mitochondrial n=1 Tax=Patellaria atrata CBS 101060 TaxID=1346257 RepID=A0A9P4SDQ4_9PEZI|nr:hypothetical protein M501DRAFT_1010764 [Patellaria atrata CBS 101060]